MSMSNEEIHHRWLASLTATERARYDGYCEGWNRAHEPANCGHARANYKDPKWGSPEYRGEERCEFCAAVAAATETVATK